MESERFSWTRSLKQPSNYLSRISYSRIRLSCFFLQQNNFHRMVSLGHSNPCFMCMCVIGVCVCVCVSGYVLTHMIWYMPTQAYVDRSALLLSKRCVKEIVSFHFPHITLHDFPPRCSHSRTLSPTLLRFPGHLAFTCLLKGILSLYSGLHT